MSLQLRVEKLESRFEEPPDGTGLVPLVIDGEVLMVPPEVPDRIEKIYGVAGGGLD